MKIQIFGRRRANSWGLIAVMMTAVALLLAACGGSSAPAEPAASSSQTDDATTKYYLNPYKDECLIGDELQLCYLASVGNNGNFQPYSGQIDNLEYEWGYGYELTGSGDAALFRVETVDNKTAEPGGIHFPMTVTGGGDRIVAVEEGVYEIYGEKSFTCAPEASCDTLDAVINREQPIAFEFQTPVDPADPLLLLNWASDTVLAQVGEQPGLMGKTWVLDANTASQDDIQETLAGTTVTAVFTLDDSFSNGTLTGNGGCNDYTANVTISGNSMTIDELEKGDAQCNNPPGIMTQEQIFTSALTVVQNFLVDGGNTLELSYNSGDSTLTFVAGE